jgi:hypothetical protein
MTVDVIRIPLDSELAEIYKTASAEDQQKIQVLLSVWLRDISTSDREPISKLMDSISDLAQERGLTTETLE